MEDTFVARITALIIISLSVVSTHRGSSSSKCPFCRFQSLLGLIRFTSVSVGVLTTTFLRPYNETSDSMIVCGFHPLWAWCGSSQFALSLLVTLCSQLNPIVAFPILSAFVHPLILLRNFISVVRSLHLWRERHYFQQQNFGWLVYDVLLD